MEHGVSVLEALVLGVVQGLTEFLPVSSSGHLILARDYLHIPEVPLLFDVLLHVATLLVIVFHYRVLVGKLIAAAWRFVRRTHTMEDAPHLRLIATIIGATVITVAIALGLKAFGLEAESRKSVSMLLLVSAALLASTPFASRFVKGSGNLGWKQAMITGVAQGFGTLAGISRSGATITASLWAGMERKKAGEYSFILSIPAVLGALVLTLLSKDSPMTSIGAVPMLVGCLSAIVTGIAALRLLLWMVREARLWYFSPYLVAVGLFGLFATV